MYKYWIYLFALWLNIFHSKITKHHFHVKISNNILCFTVRMRSHGNWTFQWDLTILNSVLRWAVLRFYNVEVYSARPNTNFLPPNLRLILHSFQDRLQHVQQRVTEWFPTTRRIIICWKKIINWKTMIK